MNRFFRCQSNGGLNFIGHDGRGQNGVSSRRVDERSESELVVIVHAFRCGRGGGRGRRRNSAGCGGRECTNASCDDGFSALAEQLAATHFFWHRILLIELCVISAEASLRRWPERDYPQKDY